MKIKKSPKYEKINIPASFSGHIISVDVIDVVTGKILKYKSSRGCVNFIVNDGINTYNFTRGGRSRIIDFDFDKDIVKKKGRK